MNVAVLFGGGAICGILGFVIDRWLHPARKDLRALRLFLSDWNGTPARLTPDGERVLEKRRPGMPERVDNIEKLLNGGGLGSRMTAIDEAQTGIATRLDSLAAAVAESREQATRAAVLAGKAATTVDSELEYLVIRVDDLTRLVTHDLTEAIARGNFLEASLHEVLRDDD